MSEMNSEDSSLGFLIVVSLYKEEIPWLYEIGLETYRVLKESKNKNSKEKEKAIYTFHRAVEMLGHPMMREFYGESNEAYMLMKDSRHLLIRFIERYLSMESFNN